MTIVIMAAVGAIALGIAMLEQRRRRPVPTSTVGEPPAQIDRADFRAPDAPWLIVVFTSAACASCERVWTELAAYESPTIVVHNSEVTVEPDLHRRYAIDSVPLAVVAGSDGMVRHAVIGPLGPRDRQRISAMLAGR